MNGESFGNYTSGSNAAVWRAVAPARKKAKLRAMLTVSLVLLMAIAGVVAWLLLSAQRETQAFDYITDQAKSLGFDRERIISFVRALPGESYDGELRGPLGALWAGGGNDLDRSLLLQALLDRSGVKSHLVQGQIYGVVIDNDGKYAGPALNNDASAKALSEVPAGAFHTVEIKVRTYTGATQPTEEGMTLRVADLIGEDVFLSYKKTGEKSVAVLNAGRRIFETTADASTALRQEVLFVVRAPDGSTVERSRELFTREFNDYPSLFNAENHYSFVVTAGWIPDSVRVHESESVQTWADKNDALDHVVAYTFLARSDDNSRNVVASKHVAAHFISPRITIVASEVSAGSGQQLRSVSLDLRKNDINVEGTQEEITAFNTLRSIYDSSLESVVLSSITGQQAISSMDLINNAVAQRNATLAERQALLQRSLGRLLDEGRAGAVLSVSPEEKQDFSVSFERKDDGLHLSASLAVRGALAKAAPQDRWVLSSPTITRDNLDQAVQEVEVALALSAKLPMQYSQHFEYSESPQMWYANSRFFQHYGPKGELTFEQQFSSLAPDLQIDALDYFDEVTNTFFDEPSHGTITVSQDDLEHSHVVTTWYNTPNDTGRTWNMFSRDAYAELKRTGTTTIQVRDEHGNDGEPMQLWVVEPEHNHTQITLNNKPFDVKVLVLAGDYVKNNALKPAKIDDLPDRTDDAGEVINKYWVLDDPNFPLLIGGSVSVQTEIPGRVVDAVSGHGVADAKVTIQEADSSATSWPDGQFALPLIQQPFGEFEITVEAPGYAPLTVKKDFRQADVFPLSLSLQPLPQKDAFVWVTRDNLGTVLATLSLSDHSKRLLSDAIAENAALNIAVPTFDVFYPYGKVDAWLEIDTRTSDVYGRIGDGLYGATTGSLIPGSKGFKAQQAVISYYSGRIASWYLFAAGAMDSVSLKIDNPQMTLPEMHKHAIATARDLAKIYDTLPFELDPGFVNSDAFKKGLQQGLDWADQFYGEAWGR